MTTPVLILAAGAARRFGRPKQLAEYAGQPLVRRAVEAVRAAALRPVVVLGAHRAEVDNALDGDCRRVVAADWDEGMGASIRCGVRNLGDDVERFAILACDQPRVTADDLRRLVEAGRECDVAAAAYDGVVGVPACFDGRWRERLEQLEGDRGAGRMLRSSALEVCEVPMPGAAVDVDTPSDLAGLQAGLVQGESA